MPEDMSVQILSQTSENIQKLFDLSTRIDERVKIILVQHENMDKRIEEATKKQTDMLQKIAIVEHKQLSGEPLSNQIEECEDAIRELDKRLHTIEGANGASNDRWNKIATFFIQLVWVILAAYLLTQMHLQPPNVP